MTDDELIEVLVDTEAGLSPTEGYGPTIEAVRNLIAERYNLRADLRDVGEALGDGWATTEATIAQGVQAVVDERDELRAHRDRVVETLEGMKSWVPTDRDLLAENARLRAAYEGLQVLLDIRTGEWRRLRHALDLIRADPRDANLLATIAMYPDQYQPAINAGIPVPDGLAPIKEGT